MSIPTPPDLVRGKVSWRIGHDRAGTTLPGASGTVRFEPTARAVSYASATVLPEPVETPVISGVMTPVDLQVNDPAVWSWRVRPLVGVEWPAFVLDVPAAGVDVARVAVVEASVPTRLVTAATLSEWRAALAGKVDDTDPRLADARTPTAHRHDVADVTGLADRLAALEYRSGVRNLSALLVNSTGTVIVERTGSTVTLQLEAITPGAALSSGGTFITLPYGVRPTRRYDIQLISAGTTTNRSGFMFAGGGIGVWLPSTSDRYRLVMTYPTNDPIPATPPGSPA